METKEYFNKGEIIIYDSIDGKEICDADSEPIVFNNEAEAKKYIKEKLNFESDRFLFVPVNYTIDLN